MSIRLVTPPVAKVIDLATAKAHCRVSFADDDAYIQGLIDTATGWIDGADGWLGRSLCPQTWELVLDRFPCGDCYRSAPVRLSLPPVTTVSSVGYVASDGTETVLAPSTYRVLGLNTIDTRLVPVHGTQWPAVRCDPDVVVVRFIAGYAAVPPPIKHAVQLMVGHLYENRESTTVERPGVLPMGAESLLWPYRAW